MADLYGRGVEGHASNGEAPGLQGTPAIVDEVVQLLTVRARGTTSRPPQQRTQSGNGG
jgi:hypothetical protein